MFLNGTGLHHTALVLVPYSNTDQSNAVTVCTLYRPRALFPSPIYRASSSLTPGVLARLWSPITMKRKISVEKENPGIAAFASATDSLPMYDGGGEGPCTCGAQDKMKTFKKIMLGFRPIAPRPTVVDPGSDVLVVDDEAAIIFCEEGTTRNYVRVGKSINLSYEGDEGSRVGREEKQSSWKVGFWECKCNEKVREKGKQEVEGEHEDEHPRIRLKLRSDACRSRSLGRGRAVEAWATVGHVREACMCDEGIGRTNTERMENLERDTCPGFVSDVTDRVQWVNGAFRKMVSRLEWREEERRGRGRQQKVEVRLEMRERIPYKAFACQMKVHYSLGKETKKPEMVPCDAWKMDGGGFAWRLDVKAALRLGRTDNH